MSRVDLEQLLVILDDESRAILWHLWWHRHADIYELRPLIDNRGDYEILHRLRGVINRKAQMLWGKPVVGFEQSKTDPVTGQKVLFSWWLLDGVDVHYQGGHKPLVDIFHEKDSVTVIAQLPMSVNKTRPDVALKNGILKVELKKAN